MANVQSIIKLSLVPSHVEYSAKQVDIQTETRWLALVLSSEIMCFRGGGIFFEKTLVYLVCTNRALVRRQSSLHQLCIGKKIRYIDKSGRVFAPRV